MTEFAHIRGLKIYIRTIGNGPFIVFLHGGPGAEHRTFLPHVLPLAEHFTLVLYDQRGCGQSERASSSTTYTIENEIETLEEIRLHLGIDQLNLVGESWGTMLALLYACKYPQHTRKLFLASAIGLNADGYVHFSEELEARLSNADRDKLADISTRLNQSNASLDELFGVLDKYYVYSPKTLAKASKTIRNPQVNEAFHQQILDFYDVTHHVTTLERIPITVLQGSQDLLSPAYIHEHMQKQLPHLQLIEVPECGHWVYIEASERFNHEVEKFFSNTDL
jgi:proline iminopeptidase